MLLETREQASMQELEPALERGVSPGAVLRLGMEPVTLRLSRQAAAGRACGNSRAYPPNLADLGRMTRPAGLHDNG